MNSSGSITRRRLLMALPLVGAGAVGAAFWKMLSGMQHGSFNPHDINAPVLNRPVPDFSLPGLAPSEGFGTQDLTALKEPVLLNFFASWCIPCVAEMPTLMAFKDQLTMWGVAYKDKPDNAAAFLRHSGNPFARLGNDQQGRTGMDWGLSGVPETFLIGPGGVIRWHTAAPLTEDILRGSILPLAARLKTP